MSDHHYLVCNYQSGPVGGPGCICNRLMREGVASLFSWCKSEMEISKRQSSDAKAIGLHWKAAEHAAYSKAMKKVMNHLESLTGEWRDN